MNLVDFDLYLEYVKDKQTLEEIAQQEKLSIEDAIKRDWDMNWKWKNREFNLSTRCITGMFARLLGIYKNSNCKKINIKCINNITDNRVINYEGYCEVQIEFNYFAYIKSDNQKKKEQALDILMAGIQKVANEYSWDVKPFVEVHSLIKENNYENRWYWIKSKSSPDRSKKAYIYLAHDVDNITLYLHIKNKQGKIVHTSEILKEQPSEWIYTIHLGDLIWSNDHEINLYNKESAIVKTIKVN